MLATFAVLAVIAALWKRQTEDPSEEVTYEARPELFSPAERSFFGVLEQAVAGQYRVMGKVRLGDLLQPEKDLTRSQRTGAWNRIHQKHVDFVLCQPDTLAVAGVVELDDASHRRKDRADRDGFVDKALSTAGIPIVHFVACKAYSVQELTAKLGEVFSLGSEASEPVALSGVVQEEQASVAVPAGLVDEIRTEENVVVGVSQDPANEQVALICSACSSPMVKRLAKKGPNAGKWFWACSAFPKCRMVVEIAN